MAPDRLTPDDIAHACHEANRALQEALGQKVGEAWADSPDWLRRSVIQGVHEAMAGATPEVLHDRWVAYKLEEGWRYGPTLDHDAKTHPCLVPHDQLGAGDRAKDSLFHAIVGALSPLLAPEEALGPEVAGCQQYHHAELNERDAGRQVHVAMYCGAERDADGHLVAQGTLVTEAVLAKGPDFQRDLQKWSAKAMADHRQATMAGPPADDQHTR